MDRYTVFTASRFVILLHWKAAKHSSTAEWENLAHSIMGYNTAIKVNNL